MLKLSREFIVRIKMSDRPAYKICADCNVDSNFLSKAINGIVPINQKDARLLKIGARLGLDVDGVFESEVDQNQM